MQPDVYLFDVDGVLIRPGGYRAAVRATVNHFSNRFGLGDLAPQDDTLSIFESLGITCEWDMVPILLATILDTATAQIWAGQGPKSLRNRRERAADRPAQPLEVDFSATIYRAAGFHQTGRALSDCILTASLDGCSEKLFPNLTEAELLKELFADTRRFDRSPATSVFETFALGEAAYTGATGLPAPAHSESLLERYDLPLLDPLARDRLLSLRSGGQARFVAYTARPSLPVSLPEKFLAVCVPEAELALGLLGIDPFPLMGSGQMCETAIKLGQDIDRLTKPAPYHAVAAIACAWTGDAGAALNWMEQVFTYFEDSREEKTAPRPTLQTDAGRLPERLRLHIFEDSPAGMRGGKQAVEMLSELGLHIELKLWGVSQHPQKRSALEAVGAQVFADVNQAFAAAVEED